MRIMFIFSGAFCLVQIFLVLINLKEKMDVSKKYTSTLPNRQNNLGFDQQFICQEFRLRENLHRHEGLIQEESHLHDLGLAVHIL